MALSCIFRRIICGRATRWPLCQGPSCELLRTAHLSPFSLPWSMICRTRFRYCISSAFPPCIPIAAAVADVEELIWGRRLYSTNRYDKLSCVRVSVTDNYEKPRFA